MPPVLLLIVVVVLYAPPFLKCNWSELTEAFSAEPYQFPSNISISDLLASSECTSSTTSLTTTTTSLPSTLPTTQTSTYQTTVESSSSSTHQIEEANCSLPYISRFPTRVLLFTNKQRRNGALILHSMLAFYCLIAVAILVQEYFVPSLERLSNVARIDEDITGATFMAAGSSAPELFISIIGSIKSNSDVGIGAVVGSAVFNILFVIGTCAVLTPSVVKLSWWPFLRDSCYYCFSAIVLVLCIMDGKIYWYESLLLIDLYVIYIIILCFNQKLYGLIAGLMGRNVEESEFLLVSDDGNQPDNTYRRFDDDDRRRPDYDDNALIINHTTTTSSRLDDANEETIVNGQYGKRKSNIQVSVEQAKKYLILPLNLAFLITIPDCRQYKFRMLFPLTFILSIVWLAVFCYLLVWMVAIIGYTLGIPDSVMGITFLAAGTSLPDTFSSIHAVKTGHVNMGVSNTIGSNLFDLLIALAVPWLITNWISKDFVTVNSRGLAIDTVLLVGTVVIAVLSIRSKGFYLDRKLGILLLGFYMIYLIISLMIELNVFGFVNTAMCSFGA